MSNVKVAVRVRPLNQRSVCGEKVGRLHVSMLQASLGFVFAK